MDKVIAVNSLIFMQVRHAENLKNMTVIKNMFKWFKKKPIKLCKDCAWCEPFSFDNANYDREAIRDQSYRMAVCNNPIASGITKAGNLTTGVREYKYQETCEIMRMESCGKKAKGFMGKSKI